jgi:dTDP-4-amino-4,6-dideoxygalactose transaminase
VAAKEGLFVLEDAAQSFGATYKGRRTGALTDVAATSFFPAKPLGCYGDGGAVLTDDDELAEYMRSIRVHGQGSNKYDNVRIGINGRLDTIQAAVLLEKLAIFPEEIKKRNRAAEAYSDKLKGLVKVPHVPEGATSVWAQYSVLSDKREHLQENLEKAGIPTAVYYPKPLHLQEAFSGLGYRRGEFPVSEEISQKIFSLPMHPYLNNETIDRIISVIDECLP